MIEKLSIIKPLCVSPITGEIFVFVTLYSLSPLVWGELKRGIY